MKTKILSVGLLMLPFILFGFNPNKNNNSFNSNVQSKVDTVIFPTNVQDPVTVKNGDLYIAGMTSSFILVDPLGGCWKSSLDGSGTISMDSIPCPGGAIPVDGDGNVYGKTTIGDQVWLDKSLHTNSYNDGTAITYLANHPAIANSVNSATLLPGYSDILFNQSNGEVYGSLYNYLVVDPALNGNKNVCPVGFRVPTETDFDELIEFIDPGSSNTVNVAGHAMRTVGNTNGTGLWQPLNSGATNSSGFSAVPGFYSTFLFGFTFTYCGLWTTTVDNSVSPSERVAYLITNNQPSTSKYQLSEEFVELRKIRCIAE